MKIRLEVKTPAGQATGTAQKLVPFLIRFSKISHNSWVNDMGDCLYIELESTPRKIVPIIQRVAMFEKLTHDVMTHPWLKKAVDKVHLVDPNDYKAVCDMMENQTTITVIKQATAQEITEDGISFWQRIKNTFMKLGPNGP
jgi:hypothetical protein